MDNNAIIESMKLEMVEKEKEFNKVIEDIKILDEKYLEKRRQLDDLREQIRGAYTALYMQLQKFNKEEPKQEEPKQEEPKQEEPYLTDTETTINETPEKESVKVKTTKKIEKKEESKTKTQKEKVIAGLTQEEIAKINQAVINPKVIDNNGNEIPDYLQEEYIK